MNKKFLLSATLLLFLIPLFCHANGAIMPLYGDLILAIFIFLGVWAIESSVIKKRISGSFRKAFYVAFIVNLVTTLIGYLSINLSFLNNFFNDTKNISLFVSFYIFVFIFTVFAETVLLYFFYKNEKRQNIIKTGLLMNFKSYIFLFLAFVYFWAFPTLGNKLGILVIVIYFIFTFLRIFDFFKDKPKINKIIKISLIILSVIILTIAVINDSNNAEEVRISRKNVQLKPTMSQLRMAAELYYSDNNNSYYNFTCEYRVAKELCEEIEKITQTKPVFYSSKDNYCSFIGMYGTKKQWICVDSTGVYRETIINPNGVGYCDGATFICPKSD